MSATEPTGYYAEGWACIEGHRTAHLFTGELTGYPRVLSLCGKVNTSMWDYEEGFKSRRTKKARHCVDCQRMRAKIDSASREKREKP